MALQFGQITKGPALGDLVDRVATQRRTWLFLFTGLGFVFVLVAIFAPLVGLLLLATLLLVGVAAGLYSRKQVHGVGRLAQRRGQRR